jgi:glycosyltransferase involved in cell wall biosynthesis
MTTGNPPSVAVVIPCWNAERWIGRAVQSVIDQNYSNLEIIVIDDGSTDGSLEVIRSFGDKICYETGPNCGACAARNRGAKISSSQYFLFLDADDYLEGPLIYSQVISSLEADSDICFGQNALELPDKSREIRSKPDIKRRPEDLLSSILGAGWVPVHSVLWKKKFFYDIGGWAIKIRQNQDGELLSRAILQRPIFSESSSGWAIYVQHESEQRVSAQVDQATLNSHLEYFTDLAARIEETEFAVARKSIARAAYGLASKSFYYRQVKTGRRALTLARACGFEGHTGNFLHRALCTIVGLDLKQRLSRTLHKIRN